MSAVHPTLHLSRRRLPLAVAAEFHAGADSNAKIGGWCTARGGWLELDACAKLRRRHVRRALTVARVLVHLKPEEQSSSVRGIEREIRQIVWCGVAVVDSKSLQFLEFKNYLNRAVPPTFCCLLLLLRCGLACWHSHGDLVGGSGVVN